MVFVKAEKVVDVALIVDDDGTGWISCRKWLCVLTEKFSVSLLILIFSFNSSSPSPSALWSLSQRKFCAPEIKS